MTKNLKICLVGAGNMGGAMLSGWLAGGIPASNVTVIDPQPGKPMRKMLDQTGVRLANVPPDDFNPDVVIIAVKPQIMDAVLPGLAVIGGSETVMVSVAAGTTVGAMESHLGAAAIVRAMPNTPALVRRGITACFANERVSAKQRDAVTDLLRAIGKVAWVDSETQIDAVTAVSGSGPAYVFHLAEVMAAAGVEQGLSEDLANELARETITGAGEMLLQNDTPASVLRENVTSPNGTTAAALAVLMSNDAMLNLFCEAIAAARKRAEELAAGN